MKKSYETPVIEKISLESEEVVCATDFYTLFGISSGSENNLNSKAQVFDWAN